MPSHIVKGNTSALPILASIWNGYVCICAPEAYNCFLNTNSLNHRWFQTLFSYRSSLNFELLPSAWRRIAAKKKLVYILKLLSPFISMRRILDDDIPIFRYAHNKGHLEKNKKGPRSCRCFSTFISCFIYSSWPVDTVLFFRFLPFFFFLSSY